LGGECWIKFNFSSFNFDCNMEGGFQTDEVYLIMAMGILTMLALSLALVLFFYKSQRRLLQEKMTAQQSELQHQEKLLYSNILTQEKERKRIAKDLHDDIGSKLNVIFLNMHRIERAAKESPPILDMVSDINQVINITIDTTRRISHDLLPPTLDNFGLIEAVKELCETYQKSDSVNVLLEVKQNDGRLVDKTTELNLFRIIQELISNSIKHGEAEQISIDLWLGSKNLKLEYRDNGKGFDLAKLDDKKGLGTQNMESRVKMMGGKMNIQSSEGEGLLARVSAEV
jgi:signal transduction histidine kinase